MSKTRLNNIKEVCERFVNETQDEGKCGNVSFSGDVFYSYSTPICVRLPDTLFGNIAERPVFLMCRSMYSNTTAHHKSYLAGECSRKGVLLAVTDELSWCHDIDDKWVEQVISDSLCEVTDGSLNLNRKEDRGLVLELRNNLTTLFEYYPNLEKQISTVLWKGLEEKVKIAQLIQNQRNQRYNK